jgi:hypothetical protein
MQANSNNTGSITSVLALDIKNAYLTVRAAPFAKICIRIMHLLKNNNNNNNCIRIKLLTELIKWFISFMSDRTIRFAFNDEISIIIEINDGIP